MLIKMLHPSHVCRFLNSIDYNTYLTMWILLFLLPFQTQLLPIKQHFLLFTVLFTGTYNNIIQKSRVSHKCTLNVVLEVKLNILKIFSCIAIACQKIPHIKNIGVNTPDILSKFPEKSALGKSSFFLREYFWLIFTKTGTKFHEHHAVNHWYKFIYPKKNDWNSMKNSQLFTNFFPIFNFYLIQVKYSTFIQSEMCFYSFTITRFLMFGEGISYSW